MRAGVISALAALLNVACGPPKPREVPGAVRGQEPVAPYATLAEQLQSPVWGERSHAILEIMRGEYREAVPELRRLLAEDEHAAVRQTAALALGQFQIRAAGATIGVMIANDTETAPEFLMDALQRLGDPENARFVLPMLDSKRDVLRLKAVETLRALEEVAATESSVALRKLGPAILAQARRQPSPEYARSYAMALGAVRARSATDYLIQSAGRMRTGPALAATYLALGRIGAPSAVPVLTQALSADFPKGRENAVQALIEIGDASAVPRAFAQLAHERVETRFAAAEVISGIPLESSGPRALNLLRERAPLSLAPAAYVIARLKYQPARGEVELQLSDATAAEREALARTLGWLGQAESVPLLLRVLAEVSGEGRYGAAWSLGILGDARALDGLRQAAGSSDRRLALLATEALGSLALPESLPDLRRAVEAAGATRYAAIDAIGGTPGSQARLMLEEFAQSSDLELQLAAVRALAGRADAAPASVPVLVAVVDRGSTEGARAAMAALRKLTGLPYENRSQWRHWFEMSELNL